MKRTRNIASQICFRPHPQRYLQKKKILLQLLYCSVEPTNNNGHIFAKGWVFPSLWKFGPCSQVTLPTLKAEIENYIPDIYSYNSNNNNNNNYYYYYYYYYYYWPPHWLCGQSVTTKWGRGFDSINHEVESYIPLTMRSRVRFPAFPQFKCRVRGPPSFVTKIG